MTFKKLVFDTAGAYIANLEVRERLALDPSEARKFSGQFTVTFSFLNGNPPVCSSGKFVGDRIGVE